MAYRERARFESHVLLIHSYILEYIPTLFHTNLNTNLNIWQLTAPNRKSQNIHVIERAVELHAQKIETIFGI